jgi:hypothetical protein
MCLQAGGILATLEDRVDQHLLWKKRAAKCLRTSSADTTQLVNKVVGMDVHKGAGNQILPEIGIEFVNQHCNLVECNPVIVFCRRVHFHVAPVAGRRRIPKWWTGFVSNAEAVEGTALDISRYRDFRCSVVCNTVIMPLPVLLCSHVLGSDPRGVAQKRQVNGNGSRSQEVAGTSGSFFQYGG